MSEQKTRVVTEYFPAVVESESAMFAFEYLRDNIQWEDGVKSKHGKTRLAKAIGIADDEVVYNLIICALKTLNEQSKNIKNVKNLGLYGCYLNYYKKGSFTPNHSHAGTCQIIISLGGTRSLQIGKKDYRMKNGDVAIFGGSTHGVPKEDTNDERISIALFAKLQ